MRCYWFGELFARQEGKKVDSEPMFLSAVLHDLGLTDHASGPHRFEIEGAGAARAFLVERGVSEDRAQRVWDNIALHTWDMNQFRGDTSRLMQRGLAYDVSGVQGAQLDPADVAEVVRRYPRLNFKLAFNEMLNHEVDCKQPYPHWFHICSRIAHKADRHSSLWMRRLFWIGRRLMSERAVIKRRHTRVSATARR